MSCNVKTKLKLDASLCCHGFNVFYFSIPVCMKYSEEEDQ